MCTILKLITALVGILLTPCRWLPEITGIALFAFLSALIALLIYRRFSNQEGISRTKKRIFGYFFGIYLFRDDPGALLGQLGHLLASVPRYLAFTLPPLVLILLPIALLTIQMQLYYGYHIPDPGDRINLVAAFSEGVNLRSERPELTASEGVAVETPPVRIPSQSQAAWRLRVERGADHRLTVRLGAETFSFDLRAAPGLSRIYPRLAPSSLAHCLLYPGSPLIPVDSQLRSIRLNYPPHRVSLLGLSTHWSIAYLILTLGFGLLLKKPLRVDF